MTDALSRLLDQLSGQAPPSGSFNAASVAGFPTHYLGHSHMGEPCLMIDTAGPRGAPHRPLRLQGLSIQYGVPCRLILPTGETIDRTLTTILCTTPDVMERRYFLYLADLILRILGPAPTLASVISAAEHLARMFQALSQPARKPLTGLIGEMLIIVRSAQPAATTMAWRSAIDDTFDFAGDDLRMEVKAGQGRSRQHYLSYDQCHPPQGTIGILASLFVESSGGGISVGELLREIEQGLASQPDALMRLREIFAQTLGATVVAALEERFDRDLADESLQLFDLSEIPAVRGPLPRGVSQVRFRADLSASTPRNPAYFRARSQTASRFLPAQ
jgi:putative PD-(D/E)XK family protein DUF4420